MIKISQTIPKEQKEIILYALKKREQQLSEDIIRYNGTDQMNMHHELFDISTLKALFKYEVNVVLNKRQHNNFTSDNGIDYPEYIDSKPNANSFLIGRTIVIHDCYDPHSLILIGKYEILSVSEKGVMKLKDYPTNVFFSKQESFVDFTEGKVAFIHPNEVYAYLKPE